MAKQFIPFDYIKDAQLDFAPIKGYREIKKTGSFVICWDDAEVIIPKNWRPPCPVQIGDSWRAFWDKTPEGARLTFEPAPDTLAKYRQ